MVKTSVHRVRKVVAEEGSATSECGFHKWTTYRFFDEEGAVIYELTMHHSEEGVKHESGS